MPRELTLVDTNVLVYALVSEAPQHARSRAVVERGISAEAGLCITPQIAAEFCAIVTSPRRVTSARSPTEAVAAMRAILSMPGMSMLPIPVDVVERFLSLIADRGLSGQRVHDAHIAAVAIANGVRRLYTFNAGDFKGYPGLEVVEP